MGKSKRAKSGIHYAERLVRDQYVQDQLRDAAARLRQAYDRVSRKRGRAAEDKELYAHLRGAATSLRRATSALQGRKPEPTHRGRKFALAALVGAGAAVVLKGRRREQHAAGLGPDLSGPTTGRSGQVVQPASPAAGG